MCFNHMLQLQIGIAENVNATLAIGQKEQIACVVPGDFVDFKVELFFCSNFVRSRIDECDNIFFVTHSDCVAIGWPGNVDVFTFCIDCCRAFANSNVPDAYSLITTGRAQQVWQRGMPAQLIHRASMASIRIIFCLKTTSDYNKARKSLSVHIGHRLSYQAISV